MEETDESEKTAMLNGNNTRSGKWSSRSNIDEEPSEEQNTLGPLPSSRSTGGHEAHRLENMKKHSSGGSMNRGTSNKSYLPNSVVTEFTASFHDGEDLIAPPVSGLLKPQESLQVVRMNELLADIKDKVFEVSYSHHHVFSVLICVLAVEDSSGGLHEDRS